MLRYVLLLITALVTQMSFAQTCNQENVNIRDACRALAQSQQATQAKNQQALQQSLESIDQSIENTKKSYQEQAKQAIQSRETAKQPETWYGNIGNSAQQNNPSTTPNRANSTPNNRDAAQHNQQQTKQSNAWNFLGGDANKNGRSQHQKQSRDGIVY